MVKDGETTIKIKFSLLRGGAWGQGGTSSKNACFRGKIARTPCVPLFCTLLNRGGNRRALGQQSFLGKRKHTPPCSSAELFFAGKKGVHRGKISVVDMAFLVFIGFLYPPLPWKVFL